MKLVQTRSLGFDSDLELLKRDMRPERYAKLWLYLKNRENFNPTNTVDSMENAKPAPKRSEILYSDRNSNSRNRPSYTYGRKSHWDTFFG